MKKYYKATGEAVNAWNKYQQQAEALKQRFSEFAKHFDAKPVFDKGVESMRFYGLKLNEYETRGDADLWTKPNKNNGFTSNLRSRITGKENAARLKALKDKYRKLWPDEACVSLEPLYKSIGCDWGTFLFSGLQLFACDDAVYLATSLNLTVGVEEITGSEYQTAKTKSES